jgi:hypothetical protein
MAVSPGYAFSLWGAGGIEKAGLRQEHKGLLRVPSLAHVILRTSNLLEAAAEVNCSCVPAGLRDPRNRSIQRIVDFEYAGTILETL